MKDFDKAKIIKIQNIIIIIVMLFIIVFLEFAREFYYFQSKKFPYLTNKIYFNNWKELGYFSAQGTWVMDNDTIGYPAQTSKITCNKREMTCVEVQAMFGIIDGIGDNNTLIVDSIIHVIDKFNNDTIQYKEEADCTLTTYTIDLKHGNISGNRVVKDINQCPIVQLIEDKNKADFISSMSETKHFHLEDGTKVAQKYDAKIETFKNTPFSWLLREFFSLLKH